MPNDADPLKVILRSARRVGNDYCWPASEIMDVLKAFEQLGRVILGIESWRFDQDSANPTVLGWSRYEVSGDSWNERVINGSRKARDEVRDHLPDQAAWISITWEHEMDSSCT